MSRFAGLVVFVAIAASPAGAQLVAVRPALIHILEIDLGFLPAEELSFKSGSVVARILTTSDQREVAIAGAMHVAVSLDYYVSRITNVGIPTPGAAKPDAGRFSSPAVAADLAAWSLSPDDQKTLDLCDPRGCNFRLDGDTIDRLRKASPKAALASDAWSAGAREAVAGYVAAYQVRGAAGLPSFKNGQTSIGPGAEFTQLHSRLSFLADADPALGQFLERYPDGRDSRSTDRFFWSLDVVMNTPVLTAMHLVVWPETSAIAERVLVTQQIYTSRDVDAQVEVTLLAADTTPAEPGVTVVTVSRSISSSLQGVLGGAKRSVARSKARDAMAEYMTTIRTAFERDAKR